MVGFLICSGTPLTSQYIENQGLDDQSIVKTTSTTKTIYLLIKESLYISLQNHIEVFIEDLNKEGYQAIIHQIPDTYTNQNHEEIRDLLLDGYQNNDLTGAILIGNLPYVIISSEDDEFISDIYYMDIDGQWIDEDENDKYETHTGNTDLEIWIGRLYTPNGGNDVELLKNYFRKNHKYRSGSLSLPKRALYYETRWDEFHDPDIEIPYLNNLQTIYTDITFIAPWDGEPSPSDYLTRLQEGYEFLYLHSWSYSTSHRFTNGQISSKDILESDPHVFFYLLSACNVANIANDKYIAGSYIFSQTYGLTAIAPTTSSYLQPIWTYPDLTRALRDGKNIGESFIENYNERISEHTEICSMYTHVLLGDPTCVLLTEYTDGQNNPPETPTIQGNKNGPIDEIQYYDISSNDNDLDMISFEIHWGDETTNKTETTTQSGEILTIGHVWSEKGTYEIKVKAIDEQGAESDWNTLEVSMPKTPRSSQSRTVLKDIQTRLFSNLFDIMK